MDNTMPILLVPGLGGSPRIYAPVEPALWRYGPVTVANHIRDDNMGAIARRILAEAPPRFVLAGHSMGGYIAFEIMRHATPPYFFSETILSGATFAAEVAAHRGWVNEAVEPALVMERAMAAAQSLAALSPPAFAQTKMQIRQAVTERLAQSGDATDKAVTEIWTAPETLGYIRDYVARTFKKS